MARTRIFKLGSMFDPSQDPGRPVNFNFKKNQNDVILVKKKKTKVKGLQPGF
jgi:hypothetical protein